MRRHLLMRKNANNTLFFRNFVASQQKLSIFFCCCVVVYFLRHIEMITLMFAMCALRFAFTPIDFICWSLRVLSLTPTLKSLHFGYGLYYIVQQNALCTRNKALCRCVAHKTHNIYAIAGIECEHRKK